MMVNDGIDSEREKANLLCLIKLTLNTLIDQSSSSTASVLDDRNHDVTNFILTLERVLNFRMRANWLSERRYFWDFARPACIGSARQSIIERVEDVSRAKNIKDKGRAWIKFALMEKKLSELLKLVISDCNLVRKFYHDDSILTSSQAFILCDQLAGLSALDFTFCFKHDVSFLNFPNNNDIDINVIDLTPYLCYKSNQTKQLLKDQNTDEENKKPLPILASINELKDMNFSDRNTIPLEKYKLEVEQRKYFEELLRVRDRELQKLKARFETLKTDRENEIIQMENIILELQLELATARGDADFKRKTSQPVDSILSPKNLFNLANRKFGSSAIRHRSEEAQMGPVNAIIIADKDETRNRATADTNENLRENEFQHDLSQSSRRSSHSTINTEDEQYELVRQMALNNNNNNNDNKVTTETNETSSLEMVSSATSLSSSVSSSEDDEMQQSKTIDAENITQPVIDESGRFEPNEITTEQATLLEEASTSA